MAIAARTDHGRDLGVLLVGECNPRNPAPHFALWPYPGSAGDRLRQHLDLSREQYTSLWRANLCASKWDDTVAVLRAMQLTRRVSVRRPDDPWWLIVTLGRKVSRAMGLAEPTFMRVRQVGDLKLLELPHPSGRCREWNDAAVTAAARDVFYSHVSLSRRR